MLDRLQKQEEDTNELIDKVRAYLFSVGVRTSRERAWDIFKNVYRIPYEMMVEKNKEIEYQGEGRHISRKHGKQFMSIHSLGKFRLQGVSSNKSKDKRASIKFEPSYDLKKYIEENVKVKNNGKE